MKRRCDDPWNRLAGLARGCPPADAGAAPPGFPSRVAAAWREQKDRESTLEALWLRLAFRFAVPSMALALLAALVIQPLHQPLDDPALAAAESMHELAFGL